MGDRNASMTFAGDERLQMHHCLLLPGGHHVPNPPRLLFETAHAFSVQLPESMTSALHGCPLSEAIAVMIRELDGNHCQAFPGDELLQVPEALVPGVVDRVPRPSG